MSRGSFGRTVARAAASGGSKSYRARPPLFWYISLVLIVVAGVGLIVYSRNEAINRASASTSAPTKSDNWYSALSFDVGGKVQPNLATNTNLSTAGIRTFGDGIVNTNPGAVADSSKFTGAHATLGTFVSTYGHGLHLTSKALALPAAGSKATSPATVSYTSGTRCTTGPDAGKKCVLEAEVWKSPTAPGHLYVGNPAAIKLTNGEMITVAFVPSGSTIPAPHAKSTLVQDLGKK